MARSGETPEELFDREWAYELMITAIDTVQAKLKTDGRETYWKIYQAYDLDPAPEAIRLNYRDDSPNSTVTPPKSVSIYRLSFS